MTINANYTAEIGNETIDETIKVELDYETIKDIVIAAIEKEIGVEADAIYLNEISTEMAWNEFQSLVKRGLKNDY